MALVEKTELVAQKKDVVVSDISGAPIPRYQEGLSRTRLVVSSWNQGGWSAYTGGDIKRTESRDRVLDVTPEECNDLIQEIDEAIRRVKLKHQSRIIGGA